MEKPLIFPFYARASLFFIGSFAFISMLYIGKSIILPLIFATIIAIVLHPVVDFLVRKKINRILAISITLVVTILIIVAFGSFMVSQISRFSESWPKLVDRFTEIFNQSVSWASGYFDISPRKINAWITKSRQELLSNSNTAIGQTLITVGNDLVVIFLIPVYIFMILYYQPLLLEGIRKLFGKSNHILVSKIITQIKTVVQRYLTGLVIEAIIVAILDSVGLMILGIDYAILLGIIGALLNVIPYIGGLIAVALPMMIAIVTKDSAWYALYVLAIYYFIQLIDNNYIVPKIVASKVKVNALVSIIVVLAFGALWGIPGMFLSIPLTAIIKVICDHIDPLKPWGYLLGDTMPEIAIFKIKIKPESIIPFRKTKKVIEKE
jgi:predicted PurR-regulated permease PerM